MSGAGDINGDGFDDIIIGARTADPNGNERAGESYVVFGAVGGFSGSLDLSSLDGNNGFVINGLMNMT
ncbi:integrin alpha, partial [Crocosphaera watsonii]|uniref:integrin alpha n=1 Tax=Crocosphaera watsonii TaxID=263511 RepID=UPI0006502A8C